MSTDRQQVSIANAHDGVALDAAQAALLADIVDWFMRHPGANTPTQLSLEVVAILRLKMRDGSEPDAMAPTTLTEADLMQMMRDPRYWRDRDPAFAEQVAEGFRRLHPAGSEPGEGR